jgi:hypothetical protein
MNQDRAMAGFALPALGAFRWNSTGKPWDTARWAGADLSVEQQSCLVRPRFPLGKRSLNVRKDTLLSSTPQKVPP